MRKKKSIELAFAIGERVRTEQVHSWGKATFEGVIVACFLKRDRTSLRYVVESDRGWVQIFKAGDLVHVVKEASCGR